MISKGFMLFLGQTGFDLFKRGLGENELVRAQHVVGVERIARGQRDAGDVAGGEREVLVFFAAGNEERGARQFQGVDDLDEILGLGRRQFQIVHDDHVIQLEPFAQGLAQRELLGLFGCSS